MAKEEGALSGQTYRWKFSEGPAKGKTYEHTFSKDGTVVFRDTESRKSAEPPRKGAGTKYGSFEITPGVHLVSYLGDSGYTLTVAMNLNSKKLHGFASNDKEWYPVSGSVEAVK